jgi:peptidoglycan/LPS O-acetylase OafA/YrhL
MHKNQLDHRNVYLDLLKVVAISLIVLHHMASLGFFESDSFFHLFFKNMWLFVDLFFVISGYLFVSKISEMKKLSFILLIKRYFQIIPVYFLFLIIAFWGKYIFNSEATEFHYSYLILTQNFLFEIPFYGVTWFLCVLEHAIILLYIIFKYCKNNRSRFLTLLCISFIPLLLRLLFVNDGVGRFNYFYWMTFTHFEGVFIGGLLFFLKNSKVNFLVDNLIIKYIFMLFLTFYIAYFPNFSDYYYNYYSYTFNSIIFAFLVLIIVRYKSSMSPLLSKPVINMSSAALILFLSHPLVLQVILKIKGVLYLDNVLVCVSLVLSWLFAMIFYNFLYKNLFISFSKKLLFYLPWGK